MGNIVSGALGEQPKKEVRLTVAHSQVLQGLGFGEKELGTLKKYFQELDDDRAGRIRLDDFSEAVGVEARFVERIFDITDGKLHGMLPFMDFALSLWNFCTLDVSELTTALFSCYDTDNNGTLSVTELTQLAKDLTPEGRRIGPKLKVALSKLEKIIESQDKMKYEHNMAKAKQRLHNAASANNGFAAEEELGTPTEVRISPQFLQSFLKQNPSLGQPLQQFHVLARQAILGDRFWTATRQRLVLLLLLLKGCAPSRPYKITLCVD